MEDSKLAQLKALTANDPGLLDTLLATITQTDKAAQEAGAVYKDAPAWAQALITRIDALEAKLKAAPTADEMIGAAADEIAATAGMEPELETEVEMEPVEDSPLLSPTEITAIAQAVAQAIMPLFDLEKKMRAMTDEIKGTVSGIAVQKTAADTATAATIGALDTRIKQLEGEQPLAATAPTRASADPATIIPTQMAEMLKQAPHTVNANGAMPSGDPIASFLSSFNVGNR